MAVFNAAKREIDIKIVYYGPALCGKTSNVQCVHKMLAPTQRGDIMSLATKDDRTLFFDFLPIELGDVKGFKTRFHVYTVPGQVYYALTRRAVLTGVDGVVFVADSQASKMDENLESLQDLNENLNYYKKDLSTIPFVMQYNKRDMNNILPIAELEQRINSNNVPHFAASAIDGTGVIETLTACCKLVFKQMDSSGGAKKRRRQHQEEAAPPAPLPSSTPPSVAKPLSFDDDDGPVIKIIADDDFSPSDTTSAGTSEPSLSSFDRAHAGMDDYSPARGTTSSSFDDLPIMDSLSDEESPSAQSPDDESFPAFDALNNVITSPDAAPTDSGAEETDQDVAQTLPLSGATAKMPQAPDSSSPIPFDFTDGAESKAPVIPSASFRLEECGEPQKITNKAVNVPLTFKDPETGQMCSVTVTVSFDDFSIT